MISKKNNSDLGGFRVVIRNESDALREMLRLAHTRPELRAIFENLKNADDQAKLAGQAGLLFNFEAFWYLVFRTCNAQLAIWYIEFCRTGNWQEHYNSFTLKQFIEAFMIFVAAKGGDDWWKNASMAAVVDGLGPYIPPREPAGGDNGDNDD